MLKPMCLTLFVSISRTAVSTWFAPRDDRCREIGIELQPQTGVQGSQFVCWYEFKEPALLPGEQFWYSWFVLKDYQWLESPKALSALSSIINFYLDHKWMSVPVKAKSLIICSNEIGLLVLSLGSYFCSSLFTI